MCSDLKSSWDRLVDKTAFFSSLKKLRFFMQKWNTMGIFVEFRVPGFVFIC